MNANLEHLDSPGALSGRLPAMTSGFVWKKGAFALGHILIVLPKAILTQVKTQRRGGDHHQVQPRRRPGHAEGQGRRFLLLANVLLLIAGNFIGRRFRSGCRRKWA
jgi:hypothetical protein